MKKAGHMRAPPYAILTPASCGPKDLDERQKPPMQSIDLVATWVPTFKLRIPQDDLPYMACPKVNGCSMHAFLPQNILMTPWEQGPASTNGFP